MKASALTRGWTLLLVMTDGTCGWLGCQAASLCVKPMAVARSRSRQSSARGKAHRTARLPRRAVLHLLRRPGSGHNDLVAPSAGSRASCSWRTGCARTTGSRYDRKCQGCRMRHLSRWKWVIGPMCPCREHGILGLERWLSTAQTSAGQIAWNRSRASNVHEMTPSREWCHLENTLLSAKRYVPCL
jgi:hypothetical protein